jgi:hypothetical protein
MDVNANSNQRLRCERFEGKPKEVILAPNYRDFTKRVAREPDLEADLEEIAGCIEKGAPIHRRFYRAGLENDGDPLLVQEGIKHLHLDHMGSDVLLFAVEYPERVVFLEVNSHKHFKTEPKGSVLLSLHQQCLKSEDEQAAGQPRVIRES